MPLYLSCAVTVSCPRRTGFRRQANLMAVFTFLQTVDVENGTDFNIAIFKVVLNIFREVQCVLTFRKKKKIRKRIETTLEETA